MEPLITAGQQLAPHVDDHVLASVEGEEHRSNAARRHAAAVASQRHAHDRVCGNVPSWTPRVAGLLTDAVLSDDLPMVAAGELWLMGFAGADGDRHQRLRSYPHQPPCRAARHRFPYTEFAQSLGLGRWEFLRRVILPGALPGFLTGLRLAVTVCRTSLVVPKQINANNGIGYLMNRARDYGQTDVLVVGLTVYKHGISEATFYMWKAKYGGLEVREAKRLRTLEDKNSRLRRMLADAMLGNAALKDPLGKKCEAGRATGGRGVSAPGLRDERAAVLPGDRRRSNEHALPRRAAG